MIKVNVVNMEPVKQSLLIIHNLLHDERVPAAIRNEYIVRFDSIKWEVTSE